MTVYHDDDGNIVSLEEAISSFQDLFNTLLAEYNLVLMECAHLGVVVNAHLRIDALAHYIRGRYKIRTRFTCHEEQEMYIMGDRIKSIDVLGGAQ